MTQKIRSGLRLPEELNIALTDIAKEMGISKNALMVQILWKWLKKEERLV